MEGQKERVHCRLEQAFTALLWRAGAGHGDEVPSNKDDSFGQGRMRAAMLLLLSRTVDGTR